MALSIKSIVLQNCTFELLYKSKGIFQYYIITETRRKILDIKVFICNTSKQTLNWSNQDVEVVKKFDKYFFHMHMYLFK